MIEKDRKGDRTGSQLEVMLGATMVGKPAPSLRRCLLQVPVKICGTILEQQTHRLQPLL